MQTESVADLLGERYTTEDPYGEDLNGPDLQAGWIPDRSLVYVPPVQLGDGLAGPENDQALQIFRDNRVIATDELGRQGPFADGPKLARHRAGRNFPLNLEWGAFFDTSLPGLAPEQDALVPSPLYWGQDPDAHDGVPPVEVLPGAKTVFYTASPNVGWTGY